VGARVQVVDCVEFDRSLRELDVSDDLAFLVFDLAARGGERFGESLVRAYREAGGEPGNDQLIAFFAAYRALVRAKVALVRAAQHPPSSKAHGQASAHARDLIVLAEQFAWFGRAAPLLFVECQAPRSVRARRAARRERDPDRISDADSAVALRETAGWQPLDELPAGAHLTLRTDRPLDQIVADVLALIDRRLGLLG
jgi:uncharacterized protein